MLTGESYTVTLGHTHWHVPVSLMVMFMPLAGLSYIILLPFIGIVLFFLAGQHRTQKRPQVN